MNRLDSMTYLHTMYHLVPRFPRFIHENGKKHPRMIKATNQVIRIHLCCPYAKAGHIHCPSSIDILGESHKLLEMFEHCRTNPVFLNFLIYSFRNVVLTSA